MPWLRADKSHPSAACPDYDNRTSQSGALRCHLNLVNSIVLIILRLVLKRSIERDNYHVLPLLSNMRDL
jgi:hypothetical protein